MVPSLLYIFHARDSLLAVDFHALLESVSDGALSGSVGLREGSRATKGTGSSAVADADDAHVVGTADASIASHALGHLDLEGKLGVGGQREALDTETGDVLGDFGVLESTRISAARGAVDSGSERTSSVLVDL